MNASFAVELLGWKLVKGKLVPNTADTANDASNAISAAVLDELQVLRGVPTGVANPKSGRPLERAVASSLRHDLPLHDAERDWRVYEVPTSISDFVQYNHLKKVDTLVKSNS